MVRKRDVWSCRSNACVMRFHFVTGVFFRQREERELWLCVLFWKTLAARPWGKGRKGGERRGGRVKRGTRPGIHRPSPAPAVQGYHIPSWVVPQCPSPIFLYEVKKSMRMSACMTSDPRITESMWKWLEKCEMGERTCASVCKYAHVCEASAKIV